MLFGGVLERFQWVLASLYSSHYKERLSLYSEKNTEKLKPTEIALRLKKPKAEQETAQPTAARFKKKTRAEQEPRSAHGRAVKKKNPYRARTALGPWPRG